MKAIRLSMETSMAGPKPKKIAVGTIASKYKIGTSVGIMSGCARYFTQVASAVPPTAHR